jgi:predicted nucleic acid-binding protein
LNSVLLDTSFLITFADPKRPHHLAAQLYFRECVARQVPMFLSAIVASEFHVKQPYTSLPLRNLIVLPFNIDHAERCGDLVAQYPRDQGDERVRVKDDFKLIAQCDFEEISHILTEDRNTLVKYVERVQTGPIPPLKALLLKDGFEVAWFNGGQMGIE